MTTPRMVDLAFALAGTGPTPVLPRRHRRSLAEAVQARLPWLADEPGAAVHRLKLSVGSGAPLLSRRTRLVLRVPRERQAEAAALAGAALELAGVPLRLGVPQVHELVPHGTLYAHLVAADDGDELRFLEQVGQALSALQVAGRPICGQHQHEDDGLQGFSLMVDGLSAAAATRLLDEGLGAHRALGCGLFVPHKSASAVGTRD